ncbi:hypothetical protein MES5069_130109 [Mesorhizobium escarrei]|uniref:Uncharacterized protein n=1 Tax=Mesorhizobium escarrei TaxID=666018 RepID=A0ABM9DI05_9HYPH|nr:hypothetical protein MES5069_130109 [Mesorhizobium escarrei]
MRRFDHEIVDATLERVEKVGNAYLSNSGVLQRLAGACNHVKTCHDHSSRPGPVRSRFHGAAVQRDWPRKIATCTMINIRSCMGFVAALYLLDCIEICSGEFPNSLWEDGPGDQASSNGLSSIFSKLGKGVKVMDGKTVLILGLGVVILLFLGFCALPT